MRALATFCLLTGLCNAATASPWPGPAIVNIAPGVYQLVSPELAGNVVGNSVAIVNHDDILVFDSTLLPASASAVLAALRRVSAKRVRYLVSSHWHPDHTGGNEQFARAFPGLEIIATQETRDLMERTTRVYVKTLELEAAQATSEIKSALESGKTADGKALSSQDRAALTAQLQLEGRFLSEYKATHVELPTLTFGDTLTLHHGGRELRLLHLAGHTSGDLALYLPAEKILLTGDLLVYPVPFCADSHPAAWIASLETLSRLDATTIIPGHGPIQHDKVYLLRVLEALRSVQRQVHAALARGLTLEETKKAIDVEAIRSQFTHDDPDLNAAFRGNFLPLVGQVYEEATEGLEKYQ